METFKWNSVKRSRTKKLLLHLFTALGKKTTALLLIAALLFSGCKNEMNPITKTSAGDVPAKKATETVSGSDFAIIVMPDTQNYMSGYFGGLYAMFTSQIDWIINNRTTENIVYVAGLGDEVEHGDSTVFAGEWPKAATNGYYRLEPYGIPYGVAVGNHEQYPVNGSILSVTTNKFNQYFGRAHFAGKPYYGGNIGGVQDSTNNSHYDLFSAGGKDFMVIYLEYDQSNQKSTILNDWAWGLCNTYASRKVIVVSHYMIGLGDPAPFGAQGQGIYDRLKDRTNVFMFLGGHIYGTSNDGEGYREDTYQGHSIRTYLSDYQQRQVGGVNKGGNGLLRMMKFSVTNDDITVKTFS
ncbi:MAG TPA: hypothetical protein VK625_22335, partial [Flavitalea sp.]|nr:hypothetical protein [Flavitalea sp.]